MYYSLTVSMYEGTKIDFRIALFLGFFQSAITSNLRALLTRSKNALLGNIFTFLFCNCDAIIDVKIILIDQAEFLREWCEYVWVFSWIYCGRSPKTAIPLFVGFLKIKNSRTSFSHFFENSLPKGFSWQNMKKSVISVLKINSRYLQSPGLNHKKLKISSPFPRLEKRYRK